MSISEKNHQYYTIYYIVYTDFWLTLYNYVRDFGYVWFSKSGSIHRSELHLTRFTSKVEGILTLTLYQFTAYLTENHFVFLTKIVKCLSGKCLVFVLRTNTKRTHNVLWHNSKSLNAHRALKLALLRLKKRLQIRTGFNSPQGQAIPLSPSRPYSLLRHFSLLTANQGFLQRVEIPEH